jgi:hypothetical protein
MISSTAARAADELRALLRDDALPRLGLVDVGKGSRLTFELAVRVTLTDLARLTARANTGHEVVADRWHQLGEDLERLHRMALAARAFWVRA